MLKLNGIKPNAGSTKTSKRVGRGNGSGKGTFSGRGCKGQNARSGGGVSAWFEGGQTPLFRRMPKLKGFSNSKFMKQYDIVNLSDLAILAEKGVTSVNKEVLVKNGLVKNYSKVKLLGKGELTKKVDVSVDKISKSAKELLEKLGAKIETVE